MRGEELLKVRGQGRNVEESQQVDVPEQKVAEEPDRMALAGDVLLKPLLVCDGADERQCVPSGTPKRPDQDLAHEWILATTATSPMRSN